jgi:hypothetical protein
MSNREQNGVASMPSPFEDTARLGERTSWDGAKGELLVDGQMVMLRVEICTHALEMMTQVRPNCLCRRRGRRE